MLTERAHLTGSHFESLLADNIHKSCVKIILNTDCTAAYGKGRIIGGTTAKGTKFTLFCIVLNAAHFMSSIKH